MIPARDEFALIEFFGPKTGPTGRHSAFSAALARAELHYQDSSGELLYRPGIVNALRELHDAPDGSPRYAQYFTPWAYLDVPGSHVDGAAPQDDTPQLPQDPQIACRLASVRAHSREAYWTLARLYGDEGNRWCLHPKEQPLGRIWALVPHTSEGQKELAREARRLAKKKATPLPLTDEERLAVLSRQNPQPTWVTLARVQAEKLRDQAWAAWEVSEFDPV